MHREFILQCVEKTFFSANIGQCTDAMMNRFFEMFAREDRRHTVVMFGDGKIGATFSENSNLKHAKDVASLEKLLAVKGGALPYQMGEGKMAVALTGIRGGDPYNAFEKVSLVLNLPRAFQVVYPSPDAIDFEDDCLVADEASGEVTLIKRSAIGAPVHSFTSQISYTAEMFHSFASYAWSVTENRDHSTFSKLNRSTEAAGAALLTDSASTQLVSLWSAFEALLPPPAKDEKGVRINHFVDFIVPCITKKYIRGKFRIFIDDAARHSSANIEKLLGDQADRSERPRLLAEILIEDGKPCRAIFNALSDSPLLLQRLFELGKLVTDPSKTRSKILSHEERVSWQLHRIYRERNLIVHSGATSDFLPILVENLFLYYRLVMRSLQQMFAQYQVYHTDSALELVSAIHAQKKARLDEVLRSTNDRNFHKSFLDVVFQD